MLWAVPGGCGARAAEAGSYQFAVAAARRQYQDQAGPYEEQFAWAVYQAEAQYQAAIDAQDPNAWTDYVANLNAAAAARQAAITPPLQAQQEAMDAAEHARTTALADAERARAERLAAAERLGADGYGVANRDYLRDLAGELWDFDYALAALDEGCETALAPLDAGFDLEYAASQVAWWNDEQAAENAWSRAAAVSQSDFWTAEYGGQVAAAGTLDAAFGLPWSVSQADLAGAMETAEAAWVGTTSAARKLWEGTVADAGLAKRGERTEAWEGRNNRLAELRAERERDAARLRPHTARETVYAEVAATLRGEREPALPFVPDECALGTSSGPDAPCLSAAPVAETDAVLAGDYAFAEWISPGIVFSQTSTTLPCQRPGMVCSTPARGRSTPPSTRRFSGR